ncbi:protein NRT1/ PTR FAMILY 4.5-like [Hordeum vulgare subsp. vulgare]|uniref:Uncharacterized protein n=2 Tax=Hordeum vulgare TaxID=4513 RepID=A0A8I6YV77_HORVV|nr:protein NRT1/ PTR FAMILY 4.5-like [Hordeum vulgare subsp. vulgare]
MGSSFGLVDFRGRPVDTGRHGGVRASMFIYIMVWLGNVVNVANNMNMVSYLRGTMNMGVAAAATTSTNFLAALQMFTIPAAFLADSYIKRFYTVLIFAPVEILGYILLAVQAHVPSLHPPACSPSEPQSCEPVHGANLSLLLLGIYMICIGEGAIRACLPALGGDQFDNADPVERRLEASFFNWYTFSVSMGAFFGLIFIVWLENNKGWDVGFAVCAGIVLLGLLIWAAGFPFYRNQLPAGSPITRIMQVIVVAWKKRNLKLPANPDDLNQMTGDDAEGLEVLHRTEGLQFLEKAAIIDNGARGSWSLCDVTQVEETKIVCRMIPIFLTSALGYTPVSIILSFTVQQGNTMDTRLGAIRVSPATLFLIPTIFQLVILVVYDRLLVPLLRRATGYVGGVTHLQRIGVGFVATVLASAAAALVETRRKGVAEGSGLVDSPAGVPMSVFWLTPQFFLLGVVDVTSFVGLLEFFYSEASAGMKSIGSSVFYCMLGLSAWFSTLTIQLVNRVTRHGDGEAGWLDGANLNRSRLDSFYWLVCVLELVSSVVYLFLARRYLYRNDQRVAAEDDKEIPSAGYVDGT